MTRRELLLLVIAGFAASAARAAGQNFPLDDPVIRRIWRLGMDSSHVESLAQTLLDSIGPRLTGSPGQQAANRWAVRTYASWGIPAREERYGTWRGWRRGATHVELIAPRVRVLEATMLAWSPGTRGRAVEGPVVILPEVADSAAFARWLPEAKGKFVLVSFAQPTCRPDDNWREWALPESMVRMQRERRAALESWTERVRRTGFSGRDLALRLDSAGALGVLSSRWSNGWGVNKIFDTRNQRAPAIDVSCEDYGLLFRLAARNQGPRIRVTAEAHFPGAVPVANVIAEIRGVEKPDEYVMLSAHYDSWDGASGATDNGTGSVTMLEAMRILQTAYPRPKRTILAGLWSGEEQGLNGSRAFVADQPRVVAGLQALFNQDGGTGRIESIGMQGFVEAGSHFARWFSRLPAELTRGIRLDIPGIPGAGGTDHVAFVCSGAPAFNLNSLGWDYGTYTWHTNRDTFDKISIDDLKMNATLVAMLAYQASEDPVRVGRTRRLVAADTTSARRSARNAEGWPICREPARSFEAGR